MPARGFDAVVASLSLHHVHDLGGALDKLASLLPPGGPIIDRIGAFLAKGLDTLIIGLADPDPRQLDLFGEKVLAKVK